MKGVAKRTSTGSVSMNSPTNTNALSTDEVPPQNDECSQSERERRRTNCLITAFGWVFDIFTVLVSLLDSVSDVMVSIQFLSEGHTVWGWLVLSSIILCSLLYTFVTVQWLIYEEKMFGERIARIPRPVLFLLILPIAQLTPTILWCVAQFCPQGPAEDSENSQWQTRNKARAVQDDADGSPVLERLDGAMETHLKSHRLFFIETMAESIPQAIIQLLALTFLNEASDWQLISLSLSLLSIVSKGYILSASAHVPTVIFKFCLVMHDVFGIFFIFASLLDSSQAESVPLLGTTTSGILLSPLSNAWLWTAIVGMGTLAVLMLVMFVMGVIAKQVSLSLKEALQALILAPLLLVPVVLAALMMQLFWVLRLISLHEPGIVGRGRIAHLYTFLRRRDYDYRLQFILGEELKELRKDESRYRSFLDGNSSAHNYYFAQRRLDYQERLEKCITTPNFQADDLNMAVSVPLYKSIVMTQGRTNHSLDKPILVLHIANTVLYTGIQVFTFCFPLIYLGFYPDTLNPIQYICFGGKMLSILVCILFLPWVIPFCRFLLHVRSLTWFSRTRFFEQWIANYYKPTPCAVLRSSISTQLLPTDLIDLLAEFVPFSATATGGSNFFPTLGLSAEDCDLIKEYEPVPIECWRDVELEERY